MEAFAQKFNERCNPIILWLSTQRHLQALKMGIIALMPIMIVMSICLCAAILFQAFDFPLPQAAQLYPMFLRFLYVYLSYEIGASLVEGKGLVRIQGGIVISFITLCIVYVTWQQNPLTCFFPVLILSLGLAELYIQISKHTLSFHNIPSAVSEYLTNLLPIMFTALAGILILCLGVDWMLMIHQILLFITSCFNSLIMVLLIIAGTCFFWMFGIHGVSVIATIARPFWFYMLLANGQSAISNQPIPYIGSEGFFQWFVWIGGSGATIGLVFYMKFFAKSKALKSLGKETFVSSFFNINEPVVFGTPIVMNPCMMVPFLLVPIISGTINYLLIVSGIAPSPILLAPWVFPAPFGALLACACNIYALLPVLITFIVSCVIYFLFGTWYDRKLCGKADTICED